jgi:pilus assembly protein CpaF
MTVSAATEVSEDLLERVRGVLASQGAPPTAARVAMALRSQGLVHGDAEVLAVVDALRRDTVGAGPLDALLRLPGVTDVLVNGPTQVYLDRGQGLEPASVCFPDDASVRRLAQRLASAGGRRLDDATPFVDVRLADGSRFHAVLSPVAKPGTCLSLRVLSQRAFTLDELVAAGSMSGSVAALLADIVAAEVAFLISGGTGTGKTTLLAALLSRVNPVHRIVLIEDAAELRPDHPHVVSLEARPPNVEGAGVITLRDLVRQALRMRPDRLVVGEVRGAEVTELLAALNTGHQGGCGTIHANGAADVPARLEALGVAAGLSRQAVHSQLASALQVILHLHREAGGLRRVSEICTIARDSMGVATAKLAVRFDVDGSSQAGPGAPRLESLLGGR